MTKNVQFLKDSLLEIETDYSHLSSLKKEIDNGNKEILGIIENKEEESITVLIDVSFFSEDITYIH